MQLTQAVLKDIKLSAEDSSGYGFVVFFGDQSTPHCFFCLPGWIAVV